MSELNQYILDRQLIIQKALIGGFEKAYDKNKLHKKNIVDKKGHQTSRWVKNELDTNIKLKNISFNNYSDFIKYISEKLYALNKFMKNPNINHTDFIDIDTWRDFGLGNKSFYDIKNKLVEKFGTNTGIIHAFEPYGYGELYKIGDETFHTYFRFPGDFVRYINEKRDTSKKITIEELEKLLKLKIPKENIRNISLKNEDIENLIFAMNSDLLIDKNKLKEYQETSSLEDIFSNNIKQVSFYNVVDTDDFAIKWSEVGDVTLEFIMNKTNKYKGIDIFKTFIDEVKDKEFSRIKTVAVRGDLTIKEAGKKPVSTTGYFYMLRWGFIPEGGIDFINKTLNEKYKNLDEAIETPGFWSSWLSRGKEFVGYFDLKKDSLSWKLLNNKF